MKSGLPNEVPTPVEFSVAHEQTKNYREFASSVGIDEIAFFIKKEDLLAALQAPSGLSPESDISGIRIYMAVNHLENGKKRSHVYVVATDEEQNDIIKDSEGKSLIYNMTWPCPNLCSSQNLLNSDI